MRTLPAVLVHSVLALVVAVAVAACGGPAATPPPGSPTPTFIGGLPVERTARDGVFILAMGVASDVWRAGVPVDLRTQLTYVGPDALAEVTGSGSGLVGFGLEQLDGPLDLGGGRTADCRAYEIARGAPMPIEYTKSGGWSEDDPNAVLLHQFVGDPLLRLPAGTFVLTARFEGYLGGCGGEAHELTVEIPLTILP